MNEFGDFVGLLGAISAGPAPDVAEKTEVDGLTVSTVNTVDCGYETALIDANTAHPVERYDTEAEAVEGHAKWIEKAETVETITKLGYGGSIKDEQVTLERKAA